MRGLYLSPWQVCVFYKRDREREGVVPVCRSNMISFLRSITLWHMSIKKKKKIQIQLRFFLSLIQRNI